MIPRWVWALSIFAYIALLILLVGHTDCILDPCQ